MIKSTGLSIAPFDAAEFLDNDETISAYLEVASRDDDPDAFLIALAAVAKARGMTEVARRSGLGRQGLYKALAPGANPHYRTIRKVMQAIGVVHESYVMSSLVKES